MSRSTSHKQAIFFLLRALVLYMGWYLLYEQWIHPGRWLDDLVAGNLGRLTEIALTLMGYNLVHFEGLETDIVTVGIDGSHGVWIGDPCNGIPLFALFAGFVIAFPGRLVNKLWYVPLGIVLVHALNFLRVLALALIAFFAPEYLDFNHNYTFTILVYSAIFYLWYLWVTKFNYFEWKKQYKA